MLHTSTYTVTGMTCAHCESAVATELSELPGVTAVDGLIANEGVVGV